MRLWLLLVLACAACDPPLDATDGAALDADLEALDAAPDAVVEVFDADPAPERDAATLPDEGLPDLGALDPDAGEPDALGEGPARYPSDRLISPLTPQQVAHLRGIVAAHPDKNPNTFAKIGASATASTSFLHCFDGPDVDLGGRDDLAPTVAFFGGGSPNPYTRVSLAAVPGRSAGWAFTGEPAPMDAELAALNPRFAAVMFGTNDLQLRDLDGYASNLLTLADRLLAEGVIPVFSSIMPRDDDAEADRRVPFYNAVVRGVAQGRQVPFVDLHRALLTLPDHGIGPDGIHPTTARSDGRSQACDFTPTGLLSGYNWRNLLTISALHGLVEAVLGGAPAPDAPHPARAETGGPNDVIPMEGLPFVDLGDTAPSPHRTLDRYPGCNALQDESGPERIYRLELARPTVLQAYVLDRGEVDVDLHLLGDPHDAGTCLQRAHRELTASLAAGTWYFVVDSFVSRGSPQAGEYLLVVVEAP